MTIQWFPGHMAKARREVSEKLKLVDIVLEIVDARLPISSRNPMLDSLIQQKPRIILLNKADLADPIETGRWQRYFEAQGHACLNINANEGKGIKKIVPKAKEILAEKIERQRLRGMKPRPIRAMCIGIPNVGKSTLLNRLAKRNMAKTGNTPGVTKGQQWLKTGNELELLDTPGILWPKFEDQEIGRKLALTGAIKDTLLHMDDLALFGLEYFKKHYPEQLGKRYQLTEKDLELSPVDILLLITEKRGFKDNYDRASIMVVQEIRDGRLGQYTLDRVEDLK
ncbi:MULTISPECIES: ribosome biogenesis GTPase YlqF [Vagococcus]|uniref:Ribosome biogenesis GTPase A n=1 Tax=Vagococcus fluvialis bH819 TaxID=1255619 RepID=A0A1X6WN72_9ENTE|nr:MULTISPECIES: ribosome biogenesis GTPase YlqF [Vagococcus]SLM85719.1 50S ribosomal subunit maturation GTPase RbgA (B. subtilis YlqF) [Vagococcus fluvialis bH819]HCM90141.1 ribosome biogenesis GTPase YlqF [Vagococcus sp.]